METEKILLVNDWGFLKKYARGPDPKDDPSWPCAKCKDWGPTISVMENPSCIPCSECGRLTWPNLGVNCPAGMAWAFSTSSTLQLLQAWEILCPHLYPKQDFMTNYFEYREFRRKLDGG